MSEGGSWQYGALCAGNYCAAMVGYAENFMTVETGDSECEYTPMPIIQALEGVTPHLLGQASGSGNRGLSFRADVDREAAAAYIDWLHSKDFYMLLTYGIEGKTWEFDENGKPRTFIIGAEVSQDDEYRYGDLWCYAPWGLFRKFRTMQPGPILVASTPRFRKRLTRVSPIPPKTRPLRPGRKPIPNTIGRTCPHTSA